MKFRRPLGLIAAWGMACSAWSSSWAQAVDRKPWPMHSLAENVSSETLRNGPRFLTIKARFATAASDENALRSLIYPARSATLSYLDGNEKWAKRALDAELLDALRSSCLGPFSVDEGRAWVQFSWVCDERPEAAISKFAAFRDSPELTATVVWDGDVIQSIEVVEPLPMPGGRLISKGAYAVMKKNG